MEEQPKFEPFQENPFFADGNSARPRVPGTVAHGSFAGTDPTKKRPFSVTRERLEKGRQSYDVFCSACHDRVGAGAGMIVQRGFPAPATFHSERLRNASDNYFFDAITNGFGRMYPFADRIPIEERWEIVAYIRVLQLSQNVRVKDIPKAAREKLERTSQ